MKFWTKILARLKPIGIILGITTSVISLGVGVWKSASFFANMKNDIMNSNKIVMDTLSELRKDFIQFQIETNKGLETHTGDIDNIMTAINKLSENQQVIISVSRDSYKIIEEIKRQQLINNLVEIKYVPSINGYVAEVKKKDLGLE